MCFDDEVHRNLPSPLRCILFTQSDIIMTEQIEYLPDTGHKTESKVGSPAESMPHKVLTFQRVSIIMRKMLHLSIFILIASKSVPVVLNLMSSNQVKINDS